jgi:hypothetical protein
MKIIAKPHSVFIIIRENLGIRNTLDGIGYKNT